MGTYNVHAGHCPQGQGASGAVGILYESIENRKVKNRVIANLQNAGNTVYDCTDDSNTTARQNLYNIVAKCNAHSVELDFSFHLDAGRNDYQGDQDTGGCTVLVTGYHAEASQVAERIAAAVSSALGIRNRGVVIRRDLYVLNHTNAPAILVECCFVDDKDDADRWDANKCADAISSAITGQAIDNVTEKVTIINATIQSNTGADCMRLIKEEVSEGVCKLKDKEQGFYMTAASADADANVDFRGFDCGDYQLWKIVKAKYKDADYTMFESVAAPGLFLSVEKNGIGSNNLKLYTDLHNQKQKFYVREENDGTMIVMHVFTMRAISAKA